MRVKKIFDSLKGIWNFYRKLKNKITEVSYGEATGTAVFEQTETNVLFYKEEGTFSSAIGERLAFYKEYFYEYSEKNDSITKYFSENRQKLGFMYDLKFSELSNSKSIQAVGKHRCTHDDYEANFVFSENVFDNFNLMYDVTGPQKNYVISTAYKRDVARSSV